MPNPYIRNAWILGKYPFQRCRVQAKFKHDRGQPAWAAGVTTKRLFGCQLHCLVLVSYRVKRAFPATSTSPESRAPFGDATMLGCPDLATTLWLARHPSAAGEHPPHCGLGGPVQAEPLPDLGRVSQWNPRSRLVHSTYLHGRTRWLRRFGHSCWTSLSS